MKNNSHLFIRIVVYFYVTALFTLGAKAQSPYLQCPPAYTCLPNITLAGGVAGSGNVGTIPVFSTTSSLASSTFTVNGNTITNSGGIDFVTTGGNDITINASGLFTVNATQLNTSNISVGSGAIDLTTSGNGTFTGTINTASLTIPSGASDGYVLTSDASGNATWQPSTGGVWQTVAFNPANFGGSGANTYTITSSADILTNRYIQNGNTVTWTLGFLFYTYDSTPFDNSTVTLVPPVLPNSVGGAFGGAGTIADTNGGNGPISIFALCFGSPDYIIIRASSGNSINDGVSDSGTLYITITYEVN